MIKLVFEMPVWNEGTFEIFLEFFGLLSHFFEFFDDCMAVSVHFLELKLLVLDIFWQLVVVCVEFLFFCLHGGIFIREVAKLFRCVLLFQPQIFQFSMVAPCLDFWGLELGRNFIYGALSLFKLMRDRLVFFFEFVTLSFKDAFIFFRSFAESL